MGKTIIVYASVHHGNTRKAAQYIAQAIGADTFDLLGGGAPELSGYDCTIFASGIYFNKFHQAVIDFISSAQLTGKRAVLLYTCGLHYRDYSSSAKSLLLRSGAEYAGCCWCRGYDTFGLLKHIGGLAKGRPNGRDLEKLLREVKRLLA